MRPWWMRCAAEPIARRANREDKVTGHFWQGRFKAQLLLDEAALLACAMYVDLNPVRAAMAKTPEESTFTGACDRLVDVKISHGQDKRKPKRPNRNWERNRRRRYCGWLSPIEINEKHDMPGASASHCGRRASVKGFLSMTLVKYLELLDWTGRQLKAGKRGAIPEHLKPILERLGIESDSWCHLVGKFKKLFRLTAGTPAAVHDESKRRGRNWMQAPGTSCFR